jgi:hypothetical protein
MLGTVAAIRGALATAMTYEVSGPGRDSLMLMAVRRLEFLTLQLRDLAAGVPGDSAVMVDALRRIPSDVVLEDGTPVELYSAFNRAWTAGFEIAGAVGGGYRIRRASDRALLPGYTSPSDLRVHEDRRGH